MKQRRWMKSMIAEAKKTEVDMPWARGARREAFKAKRAAPRAKPRYALSA